MINTIGYLSMSVQLRSEVLDIQSVLEECKTEAENQLRQLCFSLSGHPNTTCNAYQKNIQDVVLKKNF